MWNIFVVASNIVATECFNVIIFGAFYLEKKKTYVNDYQYSVYLNCVKFNSVNN